MTERSEPTDRSEPGAPPVLELTIDPELAADPTVRAALAHLGQQLAEAELLEDDEVAGFSMPDIGSISLNKSNTLGPTSTNAGCIGFSQGTDTTPTSCAIQWSSCLTRGFRS